jgi:hypothetical protein
MIFFQLTEQLSSLKNLIAVLDDEQYRRKISYLGNASIGGHSRHIIELLSCITNGYSGGEIDYVNRNRDLSIENEKRVAIEKLSGLMQDVTRPDKDLFMIVDGEEINLDNRVCTTYYREIVYNAEHAIHHLALIRVALREMKLEIVDDNFGMAYSTIKYQAQLGEN